MTLIQTAAAASALGLVAYLALSVSRGGALRITWVWPALASFAFLVYSLYTVATDGLFGFWTVQTTSLWGLQVWIDLVLAFGIAWTFMAPEARRLGMALWPWAALLLCTGCIGILAMMARILWLREQQGVAQAA